MKKALLLLAAVILTGALVTGCSQPVTSMDVTLTAPSAPAVNGDLIKAESFDGFILVTWGAGDENQGYTVYRQEVYSADTDDNSKGDVIEGSLNQLGGQIGYSNGKKIPYYVDTAILDGATYQYGIVNWGYQKGNGDAIPVSEIVWQEFDEDEKPLAVAKGSTVPAGYEQTAVTVLPMPTALPTVTPVAGGKINADNRDPTPPAGGNWIDNYETLQFKVTGVADPRYRYTFRVIHNDNSINRPGGVAQDDANWVNLGDLSDLTGNDSFAYSQNNLISKYLDTGSWAYEFILTWRPSIAGWNDNKASTPGDTTSAHLYWNAQIVCRVSSADPKYTVLSAAKYVTRPPAVAGGAATTVLSQFRSNDVKVADISRADIIVQ